MKVENHNFNVKEYYPKEYEKYQIVLHHTVSPSGSVIGDIEWWKGDNKHICTPGIIGDDGTYHRLFSSRYWSHHLGVGVSNFRKFNIDLIYRKKSNGKYYVANNTILNKHAIGLEIDSAGGLRENDKGQWVTSFGTVIEEANIEFYPNGFRNFEAFQKYTDKQISTVKETLEYWNMYYKIPIKYQGYEIMFEQNAKALSGEKGLYGHCSFRSDKSDVHPQKSLIKMLKSL